MSLTGITQQSKMVSTTAMNIFGLQFGGYSNLSASMGSRRAALRAG